MGFASMTFNPTFSAIQAPLGALVEWFAGGRQAAPCPPCTLSLPVFSSHRRTTLNAKRLRVVRVFEQGSSPGCAGRMVISGRMADVCAELNRMG